jgi:endonuclease V-like protein UPF0215 family
LSKRAVRLLGVAESTPLGATTAILAGVVMRADLIIDGMSWESATISGMDASDAVVALVRRLGREDLGGVLLHGSVIAGYNVVDLQHIHDATRLPVISVSQEPQSNLRGILQAKFSKDWQSRWRIVEQNGPLQPLHLPTGNTVFLQCYGTQADTAGELVKRLTRFGGIPEPLRVARLLARVLTASRSAPKPEVGSGD